MDEEDRQAALLALLHPRHRADAELSAQVQKLGLYKKARSKQDLEAAQKKKDKTASKHRGRRLRKRSSGQPLDRLAV